MPNFANITLIGHCGRDPELKYIPSGAAVTSLTLAVNVGKKEDPPSWYSVVFWGKQAELANEYLKKGAAVMVHGQPKIREWTDKDGAKRTTVEVNVREFTFLGSKDGVPEAKAGSEQTDDDSMPF